MLLHWEDGPEKEIRQYDDLDDLTCNLEEFHSSLYLPNFATDALGRRVFLRMEGQKVLELRLK